MDVTSSKPGCAIGVTRFFTSSAAIQTHGFTLIELLVTVAVAAILTVYALPAFRDFTNRQQQVAYINSLVSALYLARSEAITRNSDVMVCKAVNGQTCTTQGEWEQGWLVFEDRNGDRTLDSEEAVLARQARLNSITVYYRAFGSTNYLVYNARGITNTNGTYTFCDAGGSTTARALIIAKTGRPRSSATRSDGTPLNCPP
ncbi:MAG TPA: GspH/FimT family pseudopilin [Gammaproteobacteria bacterium]